MDNDVKFMIISIAKTGHDGYAIDYAPNGDHDYSDDFPSDYPPNFREARRHAWKELRAFRRNGIRAVMVPGIFSEITRRTLPVSR